MLGTEPPSHCLAIALQQVFSD